MENFSSIPKKDLVRLSVANRKITVDDWIEDCSIIRTIGVKRIFRNGALDYEIFDWSYYDVLKKNGFSYNLSNMIGLHNYLLENGYG